MFPPTGANIKSGKPGELPRVSWELNQKRTSLVGRKYKANQWQKNSTVGASDDNPNKFFQKMVGAHCNGISTRRKWSIKGQGYHINVLKLMAVKFTILTFTKNFSNLAIHIQMDNKVALTYMLEMEGTHSPEFLKISKSI